MKKAAVALVYSLNNTFVQQDLMHLKNCATKIYQLSSLPYKDPLRFLFNRFREFFFSLFFISRSKVIFCWFNDYHAFIPLLFSRIFFRKGIVIVGGYDAVSDPVFSYGLFSKNNLRQQLARLNYKLAHHIWVVDDSLAKGCFEAKEQEQIKSGIKTFMPHLKTPIETIPTGYDPNFWKCITKKTPQTILTVANVPDARTFYRKGIDLFLKLANALPHHNFTLAGLTFSLPSENELPKNVTLRGKQTAKELKELYSAHTFYFQGSRVEGLPNVLCEAMLCECIPLARNVFGMPNAVSITGFLFNPHQDWEALLQFIETATPALGKKARQRIQKHFHQELRSKAFHRIVTM